MDEIDDVFDLVKYDIYDKITKATETVFDINLQVKMYKEAIKIPNIVRKKPTWNDVYISSDDDYITKNIYVEQLKDSFYAITKISPMRIYIDDIDMYYEEKGLYDDEKKAQYMTYSIQWGGSVIFLPCILGMDVFSFLYNVAITPYVFFRYYRNPRYFYYTIGMTLRKSMVI